MTLSRSWLSLYSCFLPFLLSYFKRWSKFTAEGLVKVHFSSLSSRSSKVRMGVLDLLSSFGIGLYIVLDTLICPFCNYLLPVGNDGISEILWCQILHFQYLLGLSKVLNRILYVYPTFEFLQYTFVRPKVFLRLPTSYIYDLFFPANQQVYTIVSPTVVLFVFSCWPVSCLL